MSHDSRISTGVPGLDNVLIGGLLRAGFYLIQGDPGSGKTIIALQYSVQRIKEKQKILYLSLTETERDLKNTAMSHGWSLEGIDICDLTRPATQEAGQPQPSVFLGLHWGPGWVLQSATNVTGPYQDVSGATSPWPVAMTSPQQFLRLRQ